MCVTRFSGRKPETLAGCHAIFSKDNTKGIIMLTQELALQEFNYIDGLLYHKTAKTGNAKVGDLSGGINSNGYMVVRVKGKRRLTHRVIFLMHKGFLPKYIDHIDNDKLNNKIENLRSATFSQNQCNKPRSKNNTSGEKGVNWHKTDKVWSARISIKGRRIYLGGYKEFKDAKAAVVAKRKELHGDFANNN